MKALRFASLLVVLAAGTVGIGRAGEVLFEESFADKLGKGWSWVREDAKAWRLDKGVLVIQTSTGSLWQKQNNNHNLLLRAVPDTNAGGCAFEALVENEPTNGFEHAGLLWYADDDNYVALMKEKVGNVVVQLVSETDGKPKVGFAEKPYKEKAVWLRMEIAGGKARGMYRAPDQKAWQALGQCDLPPRGRGGARIGLMTGYAAPKAEHLARFSRFRVLQFAK